MIKNNQKDSFQFVATKIGICIVILGALLLVPPLSKPTLIEYPCNIQRIQQVDLSWERFNDEFWNKAPFILVTGVDYNAEHREFTSRENMIRRYGDELVQLGTANTYTGRKRIVRSLEEYFSYMSLDQPEERRGNETYYLFGDTPEPFWQEVLEKYKAPIFSNPNVPSPPRPAQLLARTLAIGFGGKYSGVPFHTHGPGWSEVLHGKKQWFLVPHYFGQEKESQFNSFDTEASQFQWYQSNNYTDFDFNEKGRHELFQCVIQPGEALYFPSQWFHGTLNLDPYTVFVSSFT